MEIDCWVLYYIGDNQPGGESGICSGARKPCICFSKEDCYCLRENWIDSSMPEDAARYVVLSAKIVLDKP